MSVIVITGASAGIGAATAKLLGKNAGHSIVLAARREAELKSVAGSIANVHVVPADVTKRADVVRLKDEALRAFGHVDVWINNAGRGIARSVLDLTDDDVDQMVAINVKSVLYGAQAIVPHFIERKSGHVINVSSFLAKVPLAPFRSMYSACKAALNSLSASLEMDLKDHPNIHVSVVMPGIVRTDFGTAVLGKPVPLPPNVPSQSAEEVAAVIAQAIEKPEFEVYTNPGYQKKTAIEWATAPFKS
jgi:short-subunit dehydrogenase